MSAAYHDSSATSAAEANSSLRQTWASGARQLGILRGVGCHYVQRPPAVVRNRPSLGLADYLAPDPCSLPRTAITPLLSLDPASDTGTRFACGTGLVQHSSTLRADVDHNSGL